MNLKLVDFSFGTFYSDTESDGLKTWCGSPPYAAPEIFNGEPYSGIKSDIWSLGVVLYAMVCGSLPFDAQPLPLLKQQVVSACFRVPYWLSHSCESLIRSMLAKLPCNRPTTGEIFSHPWLNECCCETSPRKLSANNNCSSLSFSYQGHSSLTTTNNNGQLPKVVVNESCSSTSQPFDQLQPVSCHNSPPSPPNSCSCLSVPPRQTRRLVSIGSDLIGLDHVNTAAIGSADAFNPSILAPPLPQHDDNTADSSNSSLLSSTNSLQCLQSTIGRHPSDRLSTVSAPAAPVSSSHSQCNSHVTRRLLLSDNADVDDEWTDDLEKIRSISLTSSQSEPTELRTNKLNEVVLRIMESYGMQRSKIMDALDRRAYDHTMATYLLLCEKVYQHRHTFTTINGQRSPSTTNLPCWKEVLCTPPIVTTSTTFDPVATPWLASSSINASSSCNGDQPVPLTTVSSTMDTTPDHQSPPLFLPTCNPSSNGEEQNPAWLTSDVHQPNSPSTRPLLVRRKYGTYRAPDCLQELVASQVGGLASPTAIDIDDEMSLA